MRVVNAKITIVAIILLVLLACSMIFPDTGTRTWTAVGDNGSEGLATGYIMVYSLDSLLIVQADDSTAGFVETPGVTILYDEMPTPSAPGTQESYDVEELMPDTVYFFSVKAYDEALNFGLLGNIPRVVTPDTYRPAAIIDLR